MTVFAVASAACGDAASLKIFSKALDAIPELVLPLPLFEREYERHGCLHGGAVQNFEGLHSDDSDSDSWAGAWKKMKKLSRNSPAKEGRGCLHGGAVTYFESREVVVEDHDWLSVDGLSSTTTVDINSDCEDVEEVDSAFIRLRRKSITAPNLTEVFQKGALRRF